MPIPVSFQSRTAVTFATNGTLFTQLPGQYGYYPVAAVQDAGDTLRYYNSAQSNNSKLGFRVNRNVFDYTVPTSKVDLSVKIAVDLRSGVNLSQATSKLRLIEAMDFVVSNYDSLLVG